MAVASASLLLGTRQSIPPILAAHLPSFRTSLISHPVASASPEPSLAASFACPEEVLGAAFAEYLLEPFPLPLVHLPFDPEPSLRHLAACLTSARPVLEYDQAFPNSDYAVALREARAGTSDLGTPFQFLSTVSGLEASSNDAQRLAQACAVETRGSPKPAHTERAIAEQFPAGRPLNFHSAGSATNAFAAAEFAALAVEAYAAVVAGTGPQRHFAVAADVVELASSVAAPSVGPEEAVAVALVVLAGPASSAAAPVVEPVAEPGAAAAEASAVAAVEPLVVVGPGLLAVVVGVVEVAVAGRWPSAAEPTLQEKPQRVRLLQEHLEKEQSQVALLEHSRQLAPPLASRIRLVGRLQP